MKLLQSLRNIFSSNINQNHDDNSKDIDILAGLMIEAANTDGNVSNDEVDKISVSLINIFKEHPKDVEVAISKALNDKDNKVRINKQNQKII